MKRFHKPTNEKRSVMVLDPGDYEGWLRALKNLPGRASSTCPGRRFSLPKELMA